MKLTKRSAKLAEEIGFDWWRAVQLNLLARMTVEHGLLDDAEQAGVAALRLEREQENRTYAVFTLAYLARAAFARGDLERAGTLWGSVSDVVPHDRAPELAVARHAEFTAARERGRHLDLWDVVAIVLDDEPAQTVP